MIANRWDYPFIGLLLMSAFVSSPAGSAKTEVSTKWQIGPFYDSAILINPVGPAEQGVVLETDGAKGDWRLLAQGELLYPFVRTPTQEVWLTAETRNILSHRAFFDRADPSIHEIALSYKEHGRPSEKLVGWSLRSSAQMQQMNYDGAGWREILSSHLAVQSVATFRLTENWQTEGKLALVVDRFYVPLSVGAYDSNAWVYKLAIEPELWVEGRSTGDRLWLNAEFEDHLARGTKVAYHRVNYGLKYRIVFRPDWNIEGGLSGFFLNYPNSDNRRRDLHKAAVLGVHYMWLNGSALRSEIMYADHASNDTRNSYKRWTGLITYQITLPFLEGNEARVVP